MSDVLQTNIFFFITAVAAVCITVVIIGVLYRLARLLKIWERMSQIIEEELYTLRGDLADARHFVQSEGIKLKHMIGFISILFTLGQKMKGRQGPRGREKHTNVNQQNNHE